MRVVEKLALESRCNPKSLLCINNFLLLMVFVSALFLVDGANAVRKAQSLGELHKAYDDELENYSRLRLELGALTSLSRIERIAVEELNMTFQTKYMDWSIEESNLYRRRYNWRLYFVYSLFLIIGIIWGRILYLGVAKKISYKGKGRPQKKK